MIPERPSAGPVAAEVLECAPAAADIVRLAVRVPEAVIRRTVPGQFANILVPEDPGWHVLRRPLSVAGIQPQSRTAVFYFRCEGPGTSRIALSRRGEQLNMLLPLGNGFTAPRPEEKVWLVGGGTGVAAVLPLPGFYPADFTLFLGFRSPEHVFGLDDVAGRETACAFDSEGVLVTDLVREALAAGRRPDRILACGPLPMYRSLAAAAPDIPTEISLEERMGCGTGGCQACVARVGGQLVRTCTDGPVFALKEVDGIAG